MGDKDLDCCFVDFQKAFDMIPHEHLWRRMEEHEVPSEYMLAISQIYKNVIYCVHIGDEILGFFKSTIGVKQGCPLSPTPFSLCIDELEELVAKFVKEETLKKLPLGR